MAVTLIVMIGGLIGAVWWLASTSPKINLPVIGLPIENEIIITTDKTEYEQGEKITATLNCEIHKDKIYQWDKFAWSIQKLENELWITIQRENDPELFCTNVSSCNNINLNEIKECPDTKFCERAMWYEVKDTPKLVWDQSYKIKEKTFSCNFIQRHPKIKEATSNKIENRSCAVFTKAQPGNYKIRFEYTTDINIDDPFSREVNIKYIEKEFTIKEKLTDFYSCDQNSDCISVNKNCCGCTAGGSAIMINKKFEDEWNEKLHCREIMCPAVMSSHPSCFQKPKCENNKCVLEEIENEDVCDVINKVDKYLEIKGIITESDPDYKDFRWKCTGINGCSWQFLGGKVEKYYACCPINFKDNKNEQVQLRCEISID